MNDLVVAAARSVGLWSAPAFEPAAMACELTAAAARTPAVPASRSRRATVGGDAFEVSFMLMLQKVMKQIPEANNGNLARHLLHHFRQQTTMVKSGRDGLFSE